MPQLSAEFLFAFSSAKSKNSIFRIMTIVESGVVEKWLKKTPRPQTQHLRQKTFLNEAKAAGSFRHDRRNCCSFDRPRNCIHRLIGRNHI